MARSVQVLVAILTTLLAAASMAADWSTTSVSFLHGTDHKLVGGSDQTIMTLEHASGWKYGDHFFFFDSYQPFADGTTIYGEWHPRLSAGKLLQRDLRFGPVKDVLLASEMNLGQDVRIYLYGVGFDLDLPHFAFFTLNVFIRDDKNIDDEATYQISPSWSLPFALGNAHFDFTGFVDIAGEEGLAGANILAQPQLLLDLGHFWGQQRRLYAGVEWQYWDKKFGVDIAGLDSEENFAQWMVKWVF
jgi:nucleoside-specific outer membrane channel protein Tsx